MLPSEYTQTQEVFILKIHNSWIPPRPKSSGVRHHDVNTRSRLGLFVSVMPSCRLSRPSGIWVSTSMLTSPWGRKSPTPSERVLQHCARFAACDDLCLSTPCWGRDPISPMRTSLQLIRLHCEQNACCSFARKCDVTCLSAWLAESLKCVLIDCIVYV